MAAVRGISCMRPRAPRRETARWSKPDSTRMTAQIRRSGTPCCAAASATTRENDSLSPAQERRGARGAAGVNAARLVVAFVGVAGIYLPSGTAGRDVSAFAGAAVATTATAARAIRQRVPAP
jgi:hypothetical protein